MFDAIVLAGGRARRLGGAAKPQLVVGGRSLIDSVVAAVHDAAKTVVVGPEQPVGGPVTFCREEPPGGGPVAAIAVGFSATNADVVLVLAADLPWIAPAVRVLLAATPPAGVAVLVDESGRVNHLAAAWRRADLGAALAGMGEPAGARAAALVAAAPQVVRVPDGGGWGRDCDTWEDLAAARTARQEDS